MSRQPDQPRFEAIDRAIIIRWVFLDLAAITFIYLILFFMSFGGYNHYTPARMIVYALLIVAFSNVVIIVIFRNANFGIEGIFGLKRKVDQAKMDFEELRDLAEAKAKREEYQEAAELFRRLAQHPLNRSPEVAAYRLAEILGHHLNRAPDAVRWFRISQAIIRNKDREPSVSHPLWPAVLRGIALFDANRMTDEKDLRQRIEYLEQAVREKNLEDAREVCQDLMRRYADRSETWFWNGLYETRIGRPGLAVERYRQAVKMAPYHLRARFNLSLLLIQQERLIEAREALQQYLAMAGDRPSESEFIAAAQKALEQIAEKLKSELPPDAILTGGDS